MARVIQGRPSGNDAEKKALNWLRDLPDDYFVFRELRVSSTFEDRVKGLLEKRPDFVVVGAKVGVVSIEVKDWNLVNNDYTWRDQYTVLKRPHGSKGAEEETLDNPAYQAAEYLQAVLVLLGSYKIDAWVTSLVAFPKNTRSGFLNRVGNMTALAAQQGKFLLDWDMTLFSEEIDDSTAEKVLTQRVRSHPKFQPIKDSVVAEIVNMLLPPTYRIGDESKTQSVRQQVRMISEKQEKWIFDKPSAAYLIDVAGSGKTTALLSKAIHLYQIAKSEHQTPPKILVTTYSEPLARSLREMFEDKMGQAHRETQEFIRIESIPSLKRWIATSTLYSESEYKTKYSGEQNSRLEKQLNQDVLLTLSDLPERFRIFDYLFIDEIQDCSDDDIAILRGLIRNHDHFFFVGDVGQRIFEREHHIARHVQQVNAVELDLSFRMYRTPRYIAKLALGFAMRDPGIAEEFQRHGYKPDAEYHSPFENGAELIHSTRLETELIDTLERYLQHFRPDDILVITSEAKRSSLQTALAARDISASGGEEQLPGTVKLIEFSSVKGLEAPIILICGIEDLPYRHLVSPFEPIDERVMQEQRSRRLVYIALTRATEECLLFYQQPSHPFIQDLCQIQEKLLKQRLHS